MCVQANLIVVGLFVMYAQRRLTSLTPPPPNAMLDSGEISLTVDTLVSMDELIQLIESPIFASEYPRFAVVADHVKCH